MSSLSPGGGTGVGEANGASRKRRTPHPPQRFVAVPASEDNKWKRRRDLTESDDDTPPPFTTAPTTATTNPGPASSSDAQASSLNAGMAAAHATDDVTAAAMSTSSQLASQGGPIHHDRVRTGNGSPPAAHAMLPRSPLSRVEWEWEGSPLPDTFDPRPEDEQEYVHYPSVRCTQDGDEDVVLHLGDAIHLKAPDDVSTRPYVARIRGFCGPKNAADAAKLFPTSPGNTVNDKYVIIEWLFRPEDLRCGRLPSHGLDELFMRRQGTNASGVYPLDCVESKCLLFDYPEYCRFRAVQRRAKTLGLPIPSEHETAYFVRSWHDNEDLYRMHKARQPNSEGGGGVGSSASDTPHHPSKLQRMVQINKRNLKGETKLHTACIKGSVDKVRRLLDDEASVDVTCNAGWTPLHEAVLGDHVSIVKMLIHRGADVNVPNPEGTLPLHDAAANNSIDMVRLLLRKGASNDIPDHRGKLPADLATNPEVVEILETKPRGRRVASMHADFLMTDHAHGKLGP
eukprot:m.44342 g.44342  ORF g.44342 m.44342 type:complete len:512 (-) comp6510_c0_seq1:144-1679(-)